VAARYESGEKFIRVFQLYTRLNDTENGLTTRQLASELEVTPRTVQRYIATLRDSVGVDIDERDGRFRVGEGSRLPAMQLDRYQATLLLVALRLLHQLRSEHDPALVGALAQLSRALHVPLVARYLARTLESAEALPVNDERRQVERAVIDAFVQSRAVDVGYADSAGKESRRVLQPYFLEPSAEGRHIYVFAHDENSGAVRPFRLDRIVKARLLAQSFRVPDDFDIDDVIRGSWGVWQAETPDDVVLRFSPEARRFVNETHWHPTAKITELPDGGTNVRMRVASEVEMRPWVLRWGALVEVIGPPSLRRYISDMMRRGAALYGQDATSAQNRKPPRRRPS
jgi:predicted DNA-binding transcriptional regulator YafY